MSSDKILQQFKFQNGVDQFSDTSPAAYPVGNPRRLFFSDTHNGVSGYPFDSFMDSGIIPPIPTVGEWRFTDAQANILQTSSAASFPFVTTDKISNRSYAWGNSGAILYRLYQLDATPTPYCVIEQYTLSIPYDLDSRSFSGSYAFATTTFFSCEPKPDGSKMYITDNNVIKQYSMTNWDITTLSYDSISYTLVYGSGGARFLFGNSGLKAYTIHWNGDTVIYEYDLSVAYDLNNISYNGNNKNIGNAVKGLFINQSTSNIYTIKVVSGDVEEYSMSVAWDITTLAATGKTTSETLLSNDFILSLNGNSIYFEQASVFGEYIDPIYKDLNQKSLSVAFDISTVIQPSETLENIFYTDVDLYIKDVFVTPDGTKMFLLISGTSNPTLYQFSLSIAHQIGSATYDSVSFSFDAQSTNINCFTFGNSGFNLYACPDSTTGYVYQYSLTSAYDISDVSYIQQKSGVCIRAESIEISPNGLHLISSNNDVSLLIYTFSVAFDASSLSLADFINDDIFAAIFNDTGSHLLAIEKLDTGQYQPDYIRAIEIPLTTPYDATTAVISKNFIAYNLTWVLWQYIREAQTPTGMSISDGNSLYIVVWGDNNVNFVLQIDLSHNCNNCWTLNSLSYSGNLLDTSADDTQPKGCFIDATGKNLVTLGSTGKKVISYGLYSKFDLSNYFKIDEFDVSTQDATPVGIFFNYSYSLSNLSGTFNKHDYYIIGGTTNTVYQYRIGDFDIGNSTYISKSLSVATQTTQPIAGIITPNGKRLFILDIAGNIYQYTLGTAWDISTGTYDIVTYLVTQDNNCSGIAFSGDGLSMFISGKQNNKIYMFTLSDLFDITSPTFDSDFSVAESGGVSGLFLKPKGNKFFVTSDTTNVGILEYEVSS